jgi:formate--tetrahydrofolate ligase
MEPIEAIAAKLSLGPETLEKYGEDKAKIKHWPGRGDFQPRGQLVLVTAMTPTPSGEGKTTTAIGLADALQRMGQKAVVALREPSLGPVFGLKGGATGGGKARVIPSEAINLHFTGDIHAITAAHNLLTAMVDNRLHFDGACGLLDCRKVTWKRVLDMDDRVLREVIVGIGGPLRGIARESGFDITAASELMAILCLSVDLGELKERLSRIIVGYGPDDQPVSAKDIKADGAMAALLRDAIKPNLVQTLEGTPALIHGGPFANIAHGTSSVIAARLGLSRADYVITECGFGSDLGAEKFFDIVVRTGHVPPPAACVLVATLRAVKYHGGLSVPETSKPDLEAVKSGFDNLRAHGAILRTFGLPLVVALNRYPDDSPEEINLLASLCQEEGLRLAVSEVYEKGGAGGEALAAEVLRSIKEDKAEFKFLYPLEASLEEKIETVAKKIYGASGIAMEGKTRRKLLKMEKDGFRHLPVCIAKTQYSLSDDEELRGRPRDFRLIVTDVSLSAGAGFVVVLCGDIMTMPGLPRNPAAERIDVTPEGEITGLT